MRTAIIFALCFVIGAIAALIGRATFHQPYREDMPAVPASAPDHQGQPAESGDHAGHEQNSPPASASVPKPSSGPVPPTPAPAPATIPATEPPAASGVVNTICAICGMDVDPTIPPIAYRGRLIGFGCGACPPKFTRDPDRYGPAALKNERVR